MSAWLQKFCFVGCSKVSTAELIQKGIIQRLTHSNAFISRPSFVYRKFQSVSYLNLTGKCEHFAKREYQKCHVDLYITISKKIHLFYGISYSILHFRFSERTVRTVGLRLQWSELGARLIPQVDLDRIQFKFIIMNLRLNSIQVNLRSQSITKAD